uniref:ATP-dependent Clp protease proteolytic subunit 3, chloroplastic n=1 Tax=Aegilops tauschii TaxID=37682 RepID=M8BU87_AEGTA
MAGRVFASISLQATEMGLQITEMLYEKIKINKIMSRITGKPEEQIDEDTKFDCFMSPWEAKDYGIIDSIIDEGKLGLVAPVSGAVPPPKSRVWYLWNASGPTRKIMKNLPSEEKLIRNGNGSHQHGFRIKDVACYTGQSIQCAIFRVQCNHHFAGEYSIPCLFCALDVYLFLSWGTRASLADPVNRVLDMETKLHCGVGEKEGELELLIASSHAAAPSLAVTASFASASSRSTLRKCLVVGQRMSSRQLNSL